MQFPVFLIFTFSYLRHHAVASNSPLIFQEGLTDALQVHSVHNSEVFSAAVRIVQTLQSSPTCNHVAALSLINSCRSLDAEHQGLPEGGNTEIILDEVKSEYAARLAVCELTGAKASVPSQCSGFVPSHQACQRSRFSHMFGFRSKTPASDDVCYSHATEGQFKSCLRALESKPQWWTSYSNARQNAVVMCQASRDAIERDKQVATFRSLAEVASEVTSALDRSLRESQTILNEQMKWIAELRLQQEQFRTDLREDEQEAQNLYRRMTDEMGSTIQSFMHLLSRGWTSVENQVGKLNASIVQTDIDVRATRRSIVDLLTEAHTLNSKFSEEHIRLYKESLLHTNALHGGLSEIKDILVVHLAQALEVVEYKAVHSQQQLIDLDQKMQSLEKTIDAANTKSKEMVSLISCIYATFSQGHNILSMVLIVFLLANKKAVQILLNGYGRRVACVLLLTFINWSLLISTPRIVSTQWQKFKVAALVVLPLASLGAYVGYRIVQREAVLAKDGFLLPKIEMPA